MIVKVATRSTTQPVGVMPRLRPMRDLPISTSTTIQALDDVLAAHRVPEPSHHDEERGVGDREGGATSIAGVACEHGKDRDDAHLHEHVCTGPAVRATVQLEVEGAVGPCDPGQGEDDRE